MTETSPTVFVTRNSTTDDYLTVGPPVPNTLSRIVDPLDSTKEFGPGEVGEIQVKGPQVSIGNDDVRNDNPVTCCINKCT